MPIFGSLSSFGSFDQAQSGRSAADRPRRQAAIERSQLSIVRDGKGEEIGIGYLSRRCNLGDIDKVGINQADIVLPKDMTGQGAQARDDRRDRRGRARRVGVSWMTYDSDHAVLGKRAGCPSLGSGCGKPVVCRIVPYVDGID